MYSENRTEYKYIPLSEGENVKIVIWGLEL